MARSGRLAPEIFREQDTERLRLRVPVADDLAAYHRLHADPMAHPHDPAGRHPDLTHSRGRIAEITEDWDRDGLGYWSVFSRAGSEYLGVAGVRRYCSGRDHRDGSWDVYYRLDPRCWGHGYAVEAISAAVRCLMTLDPDAVLRAAIRPGNFASIRVAQKLGMTLTHEQPGLTGEPELIYGLAGFAEPSNRSLPGARKRLHVRRRWGRSAFGDHWR